MICSKCQHGKIVLNAISNNICNGGCGNAVISGYVPGDLYCTSCSDNLHVCKECGKNLINNIKITLK